MNKTNWKLERMAERVWLIASSMAMEASKYGMDGRGFAVVAEETRSTANKINEALEKSLFGQEEIDKKSLAVLGTELSYLALNAAIEANRGGQRGKAMAVCAEDTRNLALELAELLGDGEQREDAPPPMASKPMTTVEQGVCLMQFMIDGYRLIENLSFIQEVVTNTADQDAGHLSLRGMRIPVIDCFSLLGKANVSPFYVILRTPWAKANERYAIAVDELDVSAIFYSPVGVPVAPDPAMALAEHTRECWESTDGEPFRFMDWPRMVKQV